MREPDLPQGWQPHKLLAGMRALHAEFHLGMDGLPRPADSAVLRRVQSPAGVWIVVAIAFVLSLPALATGLSTDDHIAASKMTHGERPWSVFSLTPEEVAKGLVNGTFAWWTSPNLHILFFRPLSTWTHMLEFQLWLHAPWAMHLLNSVMYCVLVAFAWLLYRELMPSRPRVAALAALKFAVDDGHAASVGWISGRNTLLASMFGLIALWLHVRARVTQRRWLVVASTACTLCALASAEAGLAAFGYLVAYALVFERGSLRRLVPHLIVLAGWACIYIAGDYGVRGASFYRDLSSPLVVLAQGALDLPIWLMTLFGPSGSSVVLFVPENIVRLVGLLICLPLLAAVVRAAPRTRENAFFALGALCCLPPLFTTLPQDRLLMLASFGAFGILASFIDVAASHSARLVRGTRRVLIGLHVVLAPVCFVPQLMQTLPIETAAQAIAAAVPPRAPQQVILLRSPLDILGIHVSTLLTEDPARHSTKPESLHQLYAGMSLLTLRRSDARTLELEAEEGWGRVVFERPFSTVANMPRTGSELELEGMQVRVLESTSDGRPKRVQFRFPTPLEAPDRLWLMWEGWNAVPWTPPAIGGTVTLPSLFSLPQGWA